MRKTKGEKLANNMKKRYLHATFHDQTTDIKRTTSDALVIKGDGWSNFRRATATDRPREQIAKSLHQPSLPES